MIVHKLNSIKYITFEKAEEHGYFEKILLNFTLLSPNSFCCTQVLVLLILNLLFLTVLRFSPNLS